MLFGTERAVFELSRDPKIRLVLRLAETGWDCDGASILATIVVKVILLITSDRDHSQIVAARIGSPRSLALVSTGSESWRFGETGADAKIQSGN